MASPQLPLLSLIIPAKDEADNVILLYQEIKKTVVPLGHPFEIIFIDDGSTDSTFVKLTRLHQKDKRVKIIRFRGNFGKSAALQAGFDQAKGDIIFTLDADLQDNPEAIPTFLRKLDAGYDLVSGWKRKRHDPSLTKVLPSRIINFLARILTGVPIHDTNCGFKAYRKEVIQNLNLYGELYRYIPIFAVKQNFKLAEIEIKHRARKSGQSKFGIERSLKGILDLATVIFLTGYIKRPGHFFGGLGLVSLLIGLAIGLYITYLRLTTGSIQYRHPLLMLGILLIVVGVQSVSTGLMAEMIISFNYRKDHTQKYIKQTLL